MPKVLLRRRRERDKLILGFLLRLRASRPRTLIGIRNEQPVVNYIGHQDRRWVGTAALRRLLFRCISV